MEIVLADTRMSGAMSLIGTKRTSGGGRHAEEANSSALLLHSTHPNAIMFGRAKEPHLSAPATLLKSWSHQHGSAKTRIHQIAAALLARGSLTGSERINKVPMR